MAITLVGSAKNTGQSNGNGTSGAANASGANLGVLVLGWYNGPSPTWTITDNSGGGNTWTRRVHALTPTPFGFDIWDCQGGTFINGMTVTVSPSTGVGAVVAFSFGVAFYSGVAVSSPLDGSNSVAGSSHTSTIQTGSLTPTQIGDLLVAGLIITDSQTGIPGAITINNSFTIEQQNPWVTGTNEGFALADLIYGSTSAINPTWSGLNGSVENAAGIVAYKAAAGGGGSPPIGKLVSINQSIKRAAFW